MLFGTEEKAKDSIAVIDSYGMRVTYGELSEFINTVRQSSLKRDLAFLLSKNDAGGILWSIAFLETGIVPLVLNHRIEESLLKNLYDKYSPRYIIYPDDSSDRKSVGYETLFGSYNYTLVENKSCSCDMNPELSHLLPTSGSTGSPKLVRHSYRNIFASSRNISTFFELSSNDRALLVLPLYYTMGLSVVFSHIYSGATVLITDLAMTDRKFWQFIKEERATSFTGVPFSYEILNLMRFFRMDLPDLRLLTQGGGKMPFELNMKFAKYCEETGRKWIATYGQSEGTARMAYLPPQYAVSKCGSIGIAVPNGELSLIDAEGNDITTPNTEGEMCYRGENVTLGYATCTDDLKLGDERHGFLKTGDLAYRDDDGFYFISGRKSRFLKLFGLRVSLDECENLVKSKFGVECACVGNDSLMRVCVAQGNGDTDIHGLQDSIKEELTAKTHIVASAFDIVPLKEIPKNAAGKVLYSEVDKLINK